MAGLSPNRLRALLARYGSVERIVAAHPELADWFAANQRATDRLRAYAKAVEAGRPHLTVVPPMDEPPEPLRLWQPRDLDPDDEPPGYWRPGDDELPREPVDAEPAETSGKDRHRPPDAFPAELLWRLEGLLAERVEHKENGARMPDHLTHAAIARRLGLPKPGRHRIYRAEQVRDRVLEPTGQGLGVLITHPEFCARDGELYWPTMDLACKALGCRAPTNAPAHLT